MILIQEAPIIARIIEPPDETWTQVVFGALGLTGVIVVLAVTLGAILAGVLFWIRSRSSEEGPPIHF